MRIIIPIKQVPETSNVKMDPETGTMVREGVESIINPLDLYSIETGIRLKEKYGGEIIVVSMGPKKAEEALKEAIAMGCDDGVLLTDRFFAGSDTFATSYTISKAIEKLKPFDLILCGERATDGDTAQVGPGIASLLGLPLSTFTSKVEVEDGHIKANRLIEGGYEVLNLPMPALVTVVKEIADPRLPTLTGKLKAKKLEIKQWTAKDIEADPESLGLKGSPTRVVKTFSPKVTREGKVIEVKDENSLNQALDEIIELLKEKAVI
ncbi:MULTISPECIES: electron transfer flavoprotein subunit beta/FixA family protein [Tepidanaerobacter]|uniref:electron transfer flavoprotein subunit beta/FixA family protein n=1 Tax=Tepidanaerobacter TaxID=499228 RepID=UPI000A9D5975|nr:MULTISPECIES: electron transfer flavoprotein subunit beta/FixA family protein [Tepidanaerobacter]GLI19893.1 electron transfer flavoprotein subunit beta [Tepidanaerobacter syntrophicus]GLI51522.1 electron transfer flavoprotein subunit beta [Tepidanaerobacter syntrophicus]HHV82182.1 electron transfer flavoprotein subunit beta/FixA family protein [Tepidanaerobacter syntrophicus]